MTSNSGTTPVYHPAIDRILAERLGSLGAVAEVHRAAQGTRPDPMTSLLHQAALLAGEHHIRLERRIRHTHNDLHTAAEELAACLPTEHLLTARHEELVVLAHRHHDAIIALKKTATAYAATPRAQAPDRPEGT